MLALSWIRCVVQPFNKSVLSVNAKVLRRFIRSPYLDSINSTLIFESWYVLSSSQNWRDKGSKNCIVIWSEKVKHSMICPLLISNLLVESNLRERLPRVSTQQPMPCPEDIINLKASGYLALSLRLSWRGLTFWNSISYMKKWHPFLLQLL